ncbi:hypothetical protein BXZ70DRAFT_910791 [Cristinia sonorae]|uniref:Uncharacterized protein n=1 Tax=Cristinia sonorae TaxID=1940300 RepID=A0A8K0UFV5_9AGAR|nr:hypothetical protein BXZ70DRAFT_910791 [Cristinia sonorae]
MGYDEWGSLRCRRYGTTLSSQGTEPRGGGAILCWYSSCRGGSTLEAFVIDGVHVLLHVRAIVLGKGDTIVEGGDQQGGGGAHGENGSTEGRKRITFRKGGDGETTNRAKTYLYAAVLAARLAVEYAALAPCGVAVHDGDHHMSLEVLLVNGERQPPTNVGGCGKGLVGPGGQQMPMGMRQTASVCVGGYWDGGDPRRNRTEEQVAVKGKKYAENPLDVLYKTWGSAVGDGTRKAVH